MDYLAALSAAAQRKGAPLSQSEIAQIHNGCQRETLRLRFINVIKLAGYTGDGPERICAEHIDRYMQDVPGFIRMMEDYERNYGDPD